MDGVGKSRISQAKQERLLEHFVAGLTTRMAARLVGVHRNTAAFYFYRLQEIIAHEFEAEGEAIFGGEIEVDESYFGGRRKGKRGRGAAGKTIVFGILKSSVAKNSKAQNGAFIPVNYAAFRRISSSVIIAKWPHH